MQSVPTGIRPVVAGESQPANQEDEVRPLSWQEVSDLAHERQDFEEIPNTERTGKVIEEFTLDQLKIAPGAPAEEVKRLKELLTEYESTWKRTALGQANIPEFKIDLNAEPRLTSKARFFPKNVNDEVERQLQGLLDIGAIERCDGEYRSGLVVVRKPSGELRVCVDYRKLNTYVRSHGHPIPSIRHLLPHLAKARVFVSLDLKSGYYQVKVHEHTKKYLGFVSSSGCYTFGVMPFGIKTAPAWFQSGLERIFGASADEAAGTLLYLDDLVVFGSDYDELLQRLERVLMKMNDHQLYLNLKKCKFFDNELTYLGVHVSAAGVKMDKRKITALQHAPKPRSLKECRRWLGMASFLRGFISNFSSKVARVIALTKGHKGKTFELTEEASKQIDDLVAELTTSPTVLAYPEANGTYVLDTDASLEGLGFTLLQRQLMPTDEFERVYGRELLKEAIERSQTRQGAESNVRFLDGTNRPPWAAYADKRGVDVPDHVNQAQYEYQVQRQQHCVHPQEQQDGMISCFRVLEYGSQTLTDTQKRYCVREIECLAIMEGLRKYRTYLLYSHTIVRSDHSSLRFLATAETGRLCRWALAAAEFDLDIQYRAGGKMEHVDYLSRLDNDEFEDELGKTGLDYARLAPLRSTSTKEAQSNGSSGLDGGHGTSFLRTPPTAANLDRTRKRVDKHTPLRAVADDAKVSWVQLRISAEFEERLTISNGTTTVPVEPAVPGVQEFAVEPNIPMAQEDPTAPMTPVAPKQAVTPGQAQQTEPIGTSEPARNVDPMRTTEPSKPTIPVWVTEHMAPTEQARPRIMRVREPPQEPALLRAWIYGTTKDLHEHKVPEQLALAQRRNGLLHNQYGRLYVPTTQRDFIVQLYHNHCTAHGGIRKTQRAISKKFIWEGMNDDIKDYQSRCLICIRRRKAPVRGSTRNFRMVTDVNDVVELDLVEHEQCSVLSMIDVAFRWVASCVVKKNPPAKTLLEAAQRIWLTAFGFPRILKVDEGSALVSREFKDFFKAHGTEVDSITPESKGGVAVIEGYHRYLNVAMGRLTGEVKFKYGEDALTPEVIEKLLVRAVEAWRVTPHAKLGDSPMFLTFGKDGTPRELKFAHEKELSDNLSLRMRELKQLRWEAFSRAALEAVRRQPDKADKPIEVGMLAVYTLSDKARRTRSKVTGIRRLRWTPDYSVPARIIRVDDERERVYMVPLWCDEDEPEEVVIRHRDKVVVIPRNIPDLSIDMFKADVMRDLYGSTGRKRRLDPEELEERVDRVINGWIE